MTSTGVAPAPLATPTTGFRAAWWLVLCLVGLDYFSSLAYLPSLLIQAVGPLAPLAAAFVVGVTLLVALPLYGYLVGRAPDGRGATGMIERLVPGWRGKLIVLLLLSFVATDYIVTQNLSVADAAEHLRANPYFEKHAAPVIAQSVVPGQWFANPNWQSLAGKIDQQLLVTIVLSLVSFGLWAYWRSGSPRRFLRVAAVLVVGYLAVNAIVIGSGIAWLLGEGRPLWDDWMQRMLAAAQSRSGEPASFVRLASLGVAMFPFAALGLSGFELSMAVAPMIDGGDVSANESAKRIRNMRKLLIVAAVMMSLLLLGGVTVSTVLIPGEKLFGHGPAVHRALAYLAHGGEVARGAEATALCGWFGPAFGTLYDALSIGMLCMAGACVAIALRDYVPEYLQRFGMELELAHRLGAHMRFFNVIILAVVVLFRADIHRLQWAYVMSVLALLSGAGLAATLSVRETSRGSRVRWLRLLPPTAAFIFFATMGFLSAGISVAGLEIAAAFAVGLVASSVLSRWIRSTELRFHGFDFADENSQRHWKKCCEYDFQILVPHRPGLHSRRDKELAIRKRHRLGPEIPIILIEATVADASEFYHRPLLKVSREEGLEVIVATRCASISHVLAAIALEMSRTGEPAELHFGWSNESAIAANMHFLLFGEGNIPWLVRELLERAEPNPDRRPTVILG